MLSTMPLSPTEALLAVKGSLHVISDLIHSFPMLGSEWIWGMSYNSYSCIKAAEPVKPILKRRGAFFTEKSWVRGEAGINVSHRITGIVSEEKFVTFTLQGVLDENGLLKEWVSAKASKRLPLEDLIPSVIPADVVIDKLMECMERILSIRESSVDRARSVIWSLEQRQHLVRHFTRGHDDATEPLTVSVPISAMGSDWFEEKFAKGRLRVLSTTDTTAEIVLLLKEREYFCPECCNIRPKGIDCHHRREW